MFLQLPVILFKGGGCLALGLGVYTPGHTNLPPAQSHPLDTPRDSPPPYGKQAGGTHHTRMPSCFPFPFEQQPVSSQSHNILSAWDFPFPCVTLCLVSITNATLFSLVWISKLQTYRLLIRMLRAHTTYDLSLHKKRSSLKRCNKSKHRRIQFGTGRLRTLR